MEERKERAEHGDTCAGCGYVYAEGEKIHKRCPKLRLKNMKREQRRVARLLFVASMATAAALFRGVIR